MSDHILIIIFCCLPCLACALTVYRLIHHGQVIKRLVRGTIPSLWQSTELKDFDHQVNKRLAAIEVCSSLSLLWVAVAAIVLLLCSSMLSLTTNLVFLTGISIMGIFQSVTARNEKASVQEAVKSQPSFGRFELLKKLQQLQEKAKPAQSLSPVGSLEKPALTLALGNIPSPSAGPQRTLAEENMLKRAHQDALNDGTLAVDEPMIVIFKSKEQELKIFLGKAELVWQPTVDESGNEVAGRVFCAGVNFSGAKIAHFDRLAWPETQANAFTHGWIATRERAHILLSTLWWLSDDQRIVIYELINPGQPFPIDWLPTAASRGSWQ
ncbi:MAG: hypothetical protein WC028_31240 [Candidatus Obscuribacterales bacterium]